MGLASADIDLPSFINAENTSVKARANVHNGNTMTAFELIRRISEQSTFIVAPGAQVNLKQFLPLY